MPAMANITVQNAAAANVVYVAKAPSSGDKTPAVWTIDAAHAIIGFRPRLSVLTRDNGNKNGRIVEIDASEPIITAINGVDTKVGTVPLKIYATVPTNVDAAKVQDAIVKATNAAVSTLMRSVFAEGYAPT